MQKGHPRRPSGGCSTGNIPQSGLGAGSAVLHLRRETGKSASEHGRLGDGGRALRDVVQGICRRVTYGAEELYYIQRGETGKMRLFRHRDETAGKSWRGTFPAEGAWSACRYTGSCRPTPSRGRGGGRRGLAGRHGSSRREP